MLRKAVALRLTNAAKFLVEALIEGQLTEAELIAAEQALQAGNDQPDRQILNRLKTDGVDGQGQALFSDLDQLYSLLEQAAIPDFGPGQHGQSFFTQPF